MNRWAHGGFIALLLISQVCAECSNPSIDLVFVVDSSTSLRPSEFELVKQFIWELVRGLSVSLRNVRVALVRFSSDVDVIAYLDQSTTSEGIQESIKNMAYKSGGTNTYGALEVARTEVLRADRGNRPGVPDVVLVLTDGKSWYPDKTAVQAEMLRDEGAEVVALGIGQNVLMSELQAMTSGVIRVIKNAAGLHDAVDDIRGNVCTVAEKAADKMEVQQAGVFSSNASRPLPTIMTATTTTTLHTSYESSSATPESTTQKKVSLATESSLLSTAAVSSSTASSSRILPSSLSLSWSWLPSSTLSPITASSTTALSSMTFSSSTSSSSTFSPSKTTPSSSQRESAPHESTFLSSSSSPLSSSLLLKTSSSKVTTVTKMTSTADTLSTPTVTRDESDLKNCKSQKLELIFVQDASFSVSEHSFQQAKDFIADTVRQLPIGQDKIRVALVRFGTVADVIFGLAESSDVKAVTDAVGGMEYVVGGTNTARALGVVGKRVMKDARPDARSVVVVITDGASSSSRKTRQESQNLRDAQVRIVWLYIAARDSGGLEREREGMMRKGDTTVGVSSFDDLGVETMQQILNASCEERPEPTTASPETITDVSESTNDFGSGEVSSSSFEPVLSESKQTSPPSTSDNVITSFWNPLSSSIFTAEEGLMPTLQTTETYEENFTLEEEFTAVDFDPKTPTKSSTKAISHNENSHTTTAEEPENTSKFQSFDLADDKTTGTSYESTGDNSTPQQPGFTLTQGAKERAAETKVNSENDGGSWKNSSPNVIGTVVGVLVVAAIAGGVAFVVLRKRANRKDKREINKTGDKV